MTPPDLHVIGVDPGQTTGWCLLTVPRACIYGTDPSEILAWDYGELTGPEPAQVTTLTRMVREIQSLSYRVGPAVVVEDFDVGALVTTDTAVLYSPVRIAAMIRYAEHRHELNDGKVVLQSRALAKQTMTDDRLRLYDMWVEGSDHIRDATRHAITALRRARDKPAFRDELWASPDGSARNQSTRRNGKRSELV
jgi:hypothetical protein